MLIYFLIFCPSEKVHSCYNIYYYVAVTIRRASVCGTKSAFPKVSNRDFTTLTAIQITFEMRSVRCKLGLFHEIWESKKSMHVAVLLKHCVSGLLSCAFARTIVY